MRRFSALLSALALAAGGVALGDHGPAHPDSRTQPVFDGCRRSTGEVLLGTTPQWVYVNADRSAKTLEGVVAGAAPSHEDNPTGHDSYDFVFHVLPDPAFQDLLGTANLAPEGGTIGVEWEEKAFKEWAWPSKGDRVTVIGSWIWDCGHWGSPSDPREDPEAWVPYAQYGEEFRGEKTEIHPPRAVFTVRQNAATRQGAVTRADLFISSDGTPARAQEECQLSVGLNPSTGEVNQASVVQRATGLAGACSSWQRVNDQDYEFSMPLPPGTGSEIVVDMSQRLQTVNAPEPVVTIEGTRAVVRVPFEDYLEPRASLARLPMSLEATIILRRISPPPSKRVRVEFKEVVIHTDLDTEALTEQGVTAEPSEYNLYVQVAGTWVPLHKIARGMLQARAGDRFAFLTNRATVDVWLPADLPTTAPQLRLFATGRECDLPKMDPCALTPELSFNEHPGEIAWTSNTILSQPLGYTENGEATSAGGSGGCGCYTLRWTLQRMI